MHPLSQGLTARSHTALPARDYPHVLGRMYKGSTDPPLSAELADWLGQPDTIHSLVLAVCFALGREWKELLKSPETAKFVARWRTDLAKHRATLPMLLNIMLPDFFGRNQTELHRKAIGVVGWSMVACTAPNFSRSIRSTTNLQELAYIHRTLATQLAQLNRKLGKPLLKLEKEPQYMLYSFCQSVGFTPLTPEAFYYTAESALLEDETMGPQRKKLLAAYKSCLQNALIQSGGESTDYPEETKEVCDDFGLLCRLVVNLQIKLPELGPSDVTDALRLEPFSTVSLWALLHGWCTWTEWNSAAQEYGKFLQKKLVLKGDNWGDYEEKTVSPDMQPVLQAQNKGSAAINASGNLSHESRAYLLNDKLIVTHLKQIANQGSNQALENLTFPAFASDPRFGLDDLRNLKNKQWHDFLPDFKTRPPADSTRKPSNAAKRSEANNPVAQHQLTVAREAFYACRRVFITVQPLYAGAPVQKRMRGKRPALPFALDGYERLPQKLQSSLPPDPLGLSLEMLGMDVPAQLSVPEDVGDDDVHMGNLETLDLNKELKGWFAE